MVIVQVWMKLFAYDGVTKLIARLDHYRAAYSSMELSEGEPSNRLAAKGKLIAPDRDL
jgi:hypothetical protein